MAEVTLIFEINCYEKPPRLRDRMRYAIGLMQLRLGLRKSVTAYSQASVWILNGPRLSDNESLRDRATKLIGPVGHPEANAFTDALKRNLEAAGVTVISEVTADD